MRGRYVIDDLNRCLRRACSGRNCDIVNLLIQMGADVNNGILDAFWSGNREMIDFVLRMEADDWDHILWGACLTGQRELVESMISKGANQLQTGLHYACQKGHYDLVNLMFQMGARYCGCGKTRQEHRNN